MARPKDNSLKYYNQDTKDDDNLQYVEAKHSFTGYAIVHKLWKHIYGGPGGYYCQWNELNKVLFCKNNGIVIEELNAILDTCFEDGIQIFDRKMVEEQKILTSKGIQKRWSKIVKEAGRSVCKVDKLHRLIHLQEENPQETTPPVILIPPESTQSKVKESKVKESEMSENGSHSGNFSKNGEGKSEKRMPAGKFEPPEFSELDKFFFDQLKNHLDGSKCNLTAQKFFNHYKSLGWKTAAEANVQDWKALANKWILQDLEDARKPKKNVPRDTHTADKAKVSEAKTISFIESIYAEFCIGTLKDDGVPADIYGFLVDKEMLILSSDVKANMLSQCNGDEQLAKKKAVIEYFNQLIRQGSQFVFKEQNHSG